MAEIQNNVYTLYICTCFYHSTEFPEHTIVDENTKQIILRSHTPWWITWSCYCFKSKMRSLRGPYLEQHLHVLKMAICRKVFIVQHSSSLNVWCDMKKEVLLYCYMLEWNLLSDTTMQMEGLSTPHNAVVHCDILNNVTDLYLSPVLGMERDSWSLQLV
jgi:hypothetical protein